MGERAFRLSLWALAGVIALSATSFPGSMLGFMFGIAIAFFVAGPCFIAAAMLRDAGVPATDQHVVLGLVALYVLMILVVIARAWRAWSRGRVSDARLDGLRAALFLALPVMAWLSTQAMMRAWP